MLPCDPVIKNGEQHISNLDYFALESGDKYKQVIQEESVYLGRFNKILLPSALARSSSTRVSGDRRSTREIPLFHQFIGGDLNPYVVAAFGILKDNGPKFVHD